MGFLFKMNSPIFVQFESTTFLLDEGAKNLSLNLSLFMNANKVKIKGYTLSYFSSVGSKFIYLSLIIFWFKLYGP